MRKSIILFIAIWLLSIANNQELIAQNDTTLSRIVTVERDFQPVIQSAGKINQRPAIITHELQLNPVVYSTYSEPLSIGYNVNQLPAAETRFIPQAPLNGIIQAATGHRNTHFLFNYQIHHQKKMSLNIYANHDAYWGKDALSQSKLDMVVTRHFSKADLYFEIEGRNDAYTLFPFHLDTWQTHWNVAATIGVCSTSKSAIQYRVQTGYNAFLVSEWGAEHSFRSHLDIWWTHQQHSAGVKAYLQNSFYTTQQNELQLPSTRHNIRVEPFYEYKNQHIRLHAGVNIDMNVGTGKLLSNIENLSFAPSPNVQFEWNMMNNIFHIYANATGHYGLGTTEEYLGYNRYLNIQQGFAWQTPRDYTPIDVQVGFKIRPAKTLLIDIYGGYAYLSRTCNMHAEERYDNQGLAYYSLWLSDIQRWKFGASLHYHYRDVLELNATGNYYFWTSEQPIYDRPNWDIKARLDIHIDSKWSIYSENYFAGSRMAFVRTDPGDATAFELRPIISLNIGGQYAINRWLLVYLQLNDYLNRKNDIFYGYQSQGIHFLAGIKWKF